MKKIILSTLILGTASFAGTCTSTACVGVQVTNLFLTDSGNTYVQTSGDETKLNCSAIAGSYVSIGAYDKGKNDIYAALLTAKTTKTPVTIRIKEGTPACQIIYVSM